MIFLSRKKDVRGSRRKKVSYGLTADLGNHWTMKMFPVLKVYKDVDKNYNDFHQTFFWV